MKGKFSNGIGILLGIIFSILSIAPYVILNLPLWAIIVLIFVSNLPFLGTIEEIVVWIIAIIKVLNTPQPYDFWEWTTLILFYAACIPYVAYSIIAFFQTYVKKRN